MKLTLRQQLTQFSHVMQADLFPVLEQEIGVLDSVTKRLIATLELVPLARFVPSGHGWVGPPPKDRLALASAFVAKAVYGFTTTRQLLGQILRDDQLRMICGWPTVRHVPHESTFSRAFAEFARMELPHFVHDTLIRTTHKNRLVCHIARDSTAIEARERFPLTKAQRDVRKRAEKQKSVDRSAGRKKRQRSGPRGPHKRWKGGKAVRDPNSRLHRQRSMTLSQMLEELPRQCGIGVKTSDGGNQKYWRGYKLHLDVADGQIPITALLASANLHDSQAAIPLAVMTACRVTNLYDVMDTAYDANEILERSRSLGHAPLIAAIKRNAGVTALGKVRPYRESREFTWAEQDRYRERTMIERVYARLKDEFGGRQIRVRGPQKVMAHLMFALLALTADQILKLGYKTEK